MGCGSSAPRNSTEMSKSIQAMKAALLIQNWYRRYLARLEARRRYTWSIFQTLEYAGEQDQLRLYNFFNDLMTHVSTSGSPGAGNHSNSLKAILTCPPRPSSGRDKPGLEEEDELLALTNPDNIQVAPTYKGPIISLPVTTNQLQCLIDAFKKKRQIHAKFLLDVLHETRKVLKALPNISRPSTKISQQITICGDLHGKLDDLLIIFYKNGLPTHENPYVFNGDFVDRGPHSVEVAVTLFCCLLCSPTSIYINRGNHEDHIMNLRYGFIKEIMSKYGRHATKIVRMFEEVFSHLPLATVIDNKILVCHGGVSDKTDLDFLEKIDRHKYLSALRPPVMEDEDGDSEQVDLMEWRQVLDILWSDPRPGPGCHPNTFRGGGSYFGPDVTDDILQKHKLTLLIRSHECKPEGYEFDHSGRVLTIFSASNYYEIGSNKGAYVKMTPELKPRIVQYMASKHANRKLTIKQRVSYVETTALQCLKEKIYSSQTVLLDAFQRYDAANMGMMKLADWCECMSGVLRMDLPWRSLRPKLVNCSSNGLVEYHTMFDEIKIQNKYNEDGSSVTEALYRNKDSLETIFRAIDKDNSGMISMDEFEEACVILGQHTNTTFSKEHILGMARNMDMNKDGYIDFNEFLEAFRIVDQFGRELTRRASTESTTMSEDIQSPDAGSKNFTFSPAKTR